MKLICLFVALCLLGGCSIPPELVRPDGTLVVELRSHATFYIDGYRYSTSELEIALERLSKSESLKRLELYIPSKLLRGKELPCQEYSVALLATGKPWSFYEWTPGHPETIKPTECPFAVLS